MLGHGFLVPWTQQGELGDTLDRAIRAGVVIHTFNTYGLRTGWELPQSDDDTVGGPPEYRYVLGFEPRDLVADGKFHKIAVTVDKRDYTVQTRRGYYAPQRGEGLTAKFTYCDNHRSRNAMVCATGCCCVMQWSAPSPQISSVQLIPVTSRSGNTRARAASATRSFGSLNVGMSTSPLAM